MKTTNLKLYGKYTHKDFPSAAYPSKELIYVGHDSTVDEYVFLLEYKNGYGYKTPFDVLEDFGLNPRKIVEDLGLKVYQGIDEDDCYIADYYWTFFTDLSLESLAPLK